MADRIGQQFGEYRLVDLLGGGSSSDVYLGEHIQDGTPAAIKVLRIHLAKGDRASFSKEVAAIAHLNHRHIIRIIGSGTDKTDNVPFLIMEYASGGTLRQLYPERSLVPLVTIVSYVKQIASA